MRSIGNYGERTAIQYLTSHSFHIIKQNFYTRFGELDIIAQKGTQLRDKKKYYLVCFLKETQ